MAHRLRLCVALLGLLPAAAVVQAQAVPPSPAASVSADDSLYRDLGEQDGIGRIVDGLLDRVYVDPRIGPFFKDISRKHLKRQLSSQFCELAGGPCKLMDAPDMKTAHASMDITRTDFNTLVELLQQSMAANGVPFRVQNRLLAKLAPLHRQIVNTP